MNLSGKKLTTAVLAGLMGATVAGISVVGAAGKTIIPQIPQPVVLDGTTLKVSPIIGVTKPIMKPVNVTNGVIDGTTEAGQGNIVSAGKTVGENLTALDTAVATNKNDIAANANTLHKVQGDVVDNHTAIQKEISDRQAADDKLKGDMQKNLGIIQGQQDAQDAKIDKNQKDIQTNAGNIQENKDAIKANSDKIADHEDRISSNEKNIEANANTLHKVQGDVVDNHTAIQKEISDRQAADDKLKGDMQKNLGIIQGQQDAQDAKIDKNQKDIQTNAGNIQNNTKAIEANSDKLDNHEERIASNEKNIETNAESIKKETNDRIDAVNGLQTNIDEVSGQVDALQKDSATVKEGAALINANKDAIEKVGDHEKRLETVENTSNKNAEDIGREAQNRYDADQKLQKNIDAEADARDQADRNLQNQISNNSTSINDLYGRYSSLKTDINKVGARSAALAGLHPLDFDPANKLNFAVASGSFKGENSVALGAFYRPNENIMFSAASTMGDSDNAYTFGLSFKIGPSSAKTKTTSPDAEELYKVVGELQDQLAAQQKEIEQLKADKAK